MSYEDSYAEHPTLYEALKKVGRELQPRSYLEIGVREGDSLRTLLSVCSPELVVLCDNWSGDYGGSNRQDHSHIWQVLADAKYKGNVTFLDGRSQETLSSSNGIYKRFDLILVDGDHSLEGATEDFRNTWPLLAPGGTMLADDTGHRFHPSLEQGFKDFLTEHNGEWLWIEKDHNSGISAGMKR